MTKLSIKARAVVTLSVLATDTPGQWGPLYGVYHTLLDAGLRYDSPAAHLRYRALGAVTGAMELLDALIDDENPDETPEAVKAYDLCAVALTILDAKSAHARDEAIRAAEAFCLEWCGHPVDLSKPLPEAFRTDIATPQIAA